MFTNPSKAPPYVYEKELQQLFNVLNRFFDNPKAKFYDDLGALRVCVSGGAITSVFSNSPVNDIDLYMEDLKHYPTFVNMMTKVGYAITFESPNAVTFSRDVGRRKYSVQLIKAFTGDPVRVFESYDFTICCGAYSFLDKQFVLHPRFLPDIAKRRLVYMGGSRYPICAMYRTIKYQKKGYLLPGSTVMHLGLAIARLNITTYAELKAQLRGIDTMYLYEYLQKKPDEVPFDYAEFMVEAFERLDGRPSVAEEQDDDNLF